MSVEQRILRKLIEIGEIDQLEEDKVRGIATRGADLGIEALSPLQRKVIESLFSARCEGVTDPGGHHNDCQRDLNGNEYVEALDQSAYYGRKLCERCRDETEGHRAHWERISAE